MAQTVEQAVVTKLKRSRNKPKTATQLGTTTDKLKRMAGIVQVGTLKKKGQRGRPALLWQLEEAGE